MALTKYFDLADSILMKARSIGLPVNYLVKTPGDGNCLYHAIVESLNYNGVPLYPPGHAHLLRRDVVEYVRNRWFEPFVQRWVSQQVEENQTEAYFLSFCNEQCRPGVYGEELFIYGAARLLQ